MRPVLRLSDAAAQATPEVRAALAALLLRRTRIGYLLGLLAIAAFVAINVASPSPTPAWSFAMNAGLALGLLLVLWLTTHPAGQRHVVLLTLAVIAITCAARAQAGIWYGNVAPTAIFLVVMAMTSAATLPWGGLPQLVTALLAAAAATANSYAVSGDLGPAPGHAAVAVALGLAGSVVLALEMRRHHVQLFVDNLQRRRAEQALARLNAELEARVEHRTAELAAATAALEREAQERRQAEAELRESQRRLQAVLDHADVAIYLRDLDGRYLVVNRYWLAVAGRTAEEVVGRHMDEVLQPDVAAALRAHDAEVLAAPHSLQFEETIPQLDGWHTFVSVKFAWLDAAGQPAGIWGLSTDITRRLQAEEESRRAEAALRAHQAELAHVLRLSTMGEMAAGLAHEINQPLGAIANFAQGCARRLRAGAISAADLLPVVERIAAEAMRAGEVIRRLRDLVRKEGPRQGTVDLNHLVGESLRLVHGEAEARGVRLGVELDPALPPVAGNDIQIEQVLLNLLLNGVEAAEAADTVPRVVSVRTAAVPEGVEVLVRDSGAGLPDADVFAPFFTTKPHGLGMGLSISRTIVEAHGGTLTGARNATGGSIFRIMLPAVAGEERCATRDGRSH